MIEGKYINKTTRREYITTITTYVTVESSNGRIIAAAKKSNRIMKAKVSDDEVMIDSIIIVKFSDNTRAPVRIAPMIRITTIIST